MLFMSFVAFIWFLIAVLGWSIVIFRDMGVPRLLELVLHAKRPLAR